MASDKQGGDVIVCVIHMPSNGEEPEMGTSGTPVDYVPPVRCPQCGERQNRFAGRMSKDGQGFEKIDCMVCGRVFGVDEYQELLSQARAEPSPPIKSPAQEPR